MTDQILDSILPAAMANLRQEAEEIALYPEMVNGLLRQCADDDEDMRYDAYRMLTLLPDTTPNYGAVRDRLVAAFLSETNHACRFLLVSKISRYALEGNRSALGALEEGAREGEGASGSEGVAVRRWCADALACLLEGQVRKQLEEREPGKVWQGVPMPELERVLEESRTQRGQRLEVARYEEAGLACGLECVSGVPYLFYETSNRSAWGRFLLCSVWGAGATEHAAEGERGGELRPVCLTRGDEEDGIHWVRLALLDMQDGESEAGAIYGCRVELPLTGTLAGGALLMLAEPVALDVDYLTQFPVGDTWRRPEVTGEAVLAGTRRLGSEQEPDTEPETDRESTALTVIDDSGSVRVVLHRMPDGSWELEAQCLSERAIGLQTVIHVAFGAKNAPIWQMCPIFQKENEVVRRTVKALASMPDASLYISVSVPGEDDR